MVWVFAYARKLSTDEKEGLRSKGADFEIRRDVNEGYLSGDYGMSVSVPETLSSG